MAQSADDFLKTVLRSGLLQKPDLEAALGAVSADKLTDADALAEHFVQSGRLTSFQAAKLRAGAAVGLKLGPYHVLTPIGKGGMGMVYLGLDTRTRQHVAVKVLSPQRKKQGDRHLARFLREIEISKDLLHPNLVLAQDVGQEQTVHYLVMEYIPGQTLHRLVTTSGPLSVPRAARLFCEVTTALEYAHGRGLIHRDLKPANVMVTPNDHAKVLDLGLAIMEGENLDDEQVLGGKGHVVGSFDYIAPEQTRDAARVDARADIYSLGCALYFALTGRPPFPLGGTKEKIQAHRNSQPEPIQFVNPSVPTDFAVLVHSLMAKDPAQRPATMAQVRALLEPWAVGVDGSKPMDRTGDATFQAAVAALQTAPVAVAQDEEPWGFIRPEREGRSHEDAAAADMRFKLLLVGVSVIWGLVLLLLLLIVLLR
jgi:eukaryotic-like serine/threonine-protein kinase